MSRRSKQRRRGKIRANDASSLVKFSAGASCDIVAQDGQKGRPKISMIAYTGDAMKVGFGFPVVVDLAGMRISAKQRPLFADHRPDQVVGHTTAIRKTVAQLEVEGVLSGHNAKTEEIIATAGNGFPWQASIGADMVRREFVRAGASVKVNGRTFRGPLIVARETVLKEVSVVSLGGDDNTSTSIAARRREAHMDEFEKWLKAKNINPDSLDDATRDYLEASFKAETGTDGGNPPANGTVTASAGDVDSMVGAIRGAAASEHQRIADVSAILQDHPQLRAKAVADGWDKTKAELEKVKAERPTVNGITRAGSGENGQISAKVIEAGLLKSVGMDNKTRESHFDERTLEAARVFEHIGLQDLVRLACMAEGVYTSPVLDNGMIEAAFSTTALPGILENTLNKLALQAYTASEIQAMRIARVTSTPDFKQVSRLRMLGTGRFSRVGAGGELQSGTISDQKYTNQADTFGQALAIDRQTIYNDDLQMLRDAATEIGNEGREILNEITFEALLAADGNYFTAENTITGAGTELNETSLNAAATKFMKQKAGPGNKAKDKRSINIEPAILVVPPELMVKAQILVGSNDIRPGGSNSDDSRGNYNPWRGRFRVVVAPHLSDDYFSGASPIRWFLMADPNRLPALELTFVRGVQEPRVERIQLPGNQLGIGYRGYIDAGAARMDPKGIVRSDGTPAA